MRQIKKMGGMNSILNMMPGMSQMKGNVEIDEKSMDKVEAIILSMTREERANPSLLNPSPRFLRQIVHSFGYPCNILRHVLQW